MSNVTPRPTKEQINAKAACTTRKHSLWQQIYDHDIPAKCELTGPEAAVLQYLANRCGMNAARAWSVSQKQIAHQTRWKRDTVRKAIKRLAALKIITVDAGRGRGHIHRYTLPADLAAIPAPVPEPYEKGAESAPSANNGKPHEKGGENAPSAEKGRRERIEKGAENAPVVEVVDLMDGWMEDIDPSIHKLSADEIALNRAMLTDSYVTEHGMIGEKTVERLAAAVEPTRAFPFIANYIEERRQGRAKGPALLIHRLKADPADFPKPEITDAAAQSGFCHRFWQEVDAITAPETEPPQVEQPDAESEPAAVHTPAPRAPRMPAMPPDDWTDYQKLQRLNDIINYPQGPGDDPAYRAGAEQRKLAIVRPSPSSTANEPASARSEPLRSADTSETPRNDPQKPQETTIPNRTNACKFVFQQVIENQPWPVPERAQRRLDEEIARVRANTQLQPDEAQTRMNLATFNIIHEIEQGRRPNHEPRRKNLD